MRGSHILGGAALIIGSGLLVGCGGSSGDDNAADRAYPAKNKPVTLSIDYPKRNAELAQSTVMLRGTTVPGATVTSGTATVVADSAGRWQLERPLKPGLQSINVAVERAGYKPAFRSISVVRLRTAAEQKQLARKNARLQERARRSRGGSAGGGSWAGWTPESLAEDIQTQIEQDGMGSKVTNVVCAKRTDTTFDCNGEFEASREYARAQMGAIDTSNFGEADWEVVEQQNSGPFSLAVTVNADGSYVSHRQ